MQNKTISDRSLEEITEIDKIANFFGFKSIKPPTLEKRDFDVVKNLNEKGHLTEKAAILRIYTEEKMFASPQPVNFYCERPFPGSKEHRRPSLLEASLFSIGSSKSVCECILIQTGVAILNEIGYKNLTIHINSVGDKESSGEFQKKLTAFVRKNFNNFPANLRQVLKKDLGIILTEENEDWIPFQMESPKSVDFLSESSRQHFKEVLEFLEILEMPYEIDYHLISDFNFGSETVFSIKDGEETLANGFCFSRLAKKVGAKKDASGCVLDFSAHLKKKLKKVKAKVFKPEFYLIQLSPEAKLKSFLALKELYKAGTTVLHTIAKDKLSGQIGAAENSGATYIILIGQKEALENNVIIRNTTNHAQEVVALENLATRAKELIKNIK